MVKKTVGYVELEWVCPQCESRNRGTSKKCTSCGAAQPEDLQFHQAAQETLISDEAEIARAKAGPDIHCGYCGTRNPAGAKTCRQCGGDLTAGEARQAGRVVGAHRAAPAGEATCPHCGATNPATALECSQCGGAMKPVAPARPAPAAAQPARKLSPMAIVGIAMAVLVGLVLCVLLITSLSSTEAVNATVQSVQWQRSIVIQGLHDVTRETWEDEIPDGATAGACTERVRSTQDEPAPRSVEVCGTPYTVDTGTGHGEVVQDCVYEVYDDWCEYVTQEWAVVDSVAVSGSDLNPTWPDVAVATNQREAGREETFQVVFATEDRTYTHTVSDVSTFQQYQIGSRWVLTINKLGGITDIEPAE